MHHFGLKQTSQDLALLAILDLALRAGDRARDRNAPYCDGRFHSQLQSLICLALRQPRIGHFFERLILAPGRTCADRSCM